MPRHASASRTTSGGRRTARPTEPEVVDLPIGDTRPYPHQADIYGDLAEPQMQMLIDSLDADGQREPIHVLPPGNAAGLPAHTVIDGHQRLAAASSLDWRSIEATVRWDLLDTDADDIHRFYLRFNMERRQLSPMQQAIVLMEMHESITGRTRSTFRTDDWHRIREQIAEYLSVTPRNAMRYVRVLCAPSAIHIAVRDGRLKCLGIAERIETLPRDQQDDLAEQIELIDDPGEAKALVEKYIPRRHSQRSLDKELDALCAALDAAAESLTPKIDDITHPSWRNYVDRLDAGMRMVARLVDQLRPIDPNADPLDDLMNQVSDDGHGA